MRPYGLRKRKSKMHPHNECGICSAYPPTKGQARMQNKIEMKTLVNIQQFPQPDGAQHQHIS